MNQIDHFVVIRTIGELYGTGTGMILLTIISSLNISNQFMVTINKNEGILIMEVFGFIVLARIVTDKNYELNEEFGKIRGE